MAVASDFNRTFAHGALNPCTVARFCTAPRLRVTADKGGNFEARDRQASSTVDRAKYVGCTTETARGIAAYDQHSNRIGMFATTDAAVRGGAHHHGGST
jgi:hypothetical protein